MAFMKTSKWSTGLSLSLSDDSVQIIPTAANDVDDDDGQ